MNKRPSQAQIARELGLAKSLVTKLKKKGMPVYSAEAARAWRKQNVAPTAHKLDSEPAPSYQASQPPDDDIDTTAKEDFAEARARRETAEADLAEIAVREKRGELIEVKAVEAVWSTAFASVRGHLLQLRARLAPMLAAESDAFKVDQMLDAELNKALDFLAGAEVAP